MQHRQSARWHEWRLMQRPPPPAPFIDFAAPDSGRRRHSHSLGALDSRARKINNLTQRAVGPRKIIPPT